MEKFDPIETIRGKLNQIPEKDLYGNNNRFQNQFATWLLGGMIESAKDKDVRNLGNNLRRGAEKSFGDLIGQKIADEINKFLKN